eukprot:jgi/Bigna1/141396/aug1.62_g16104
MVAYGAACFHYHEIAFAEPGERLGETELILPASERKLNRQSSLVTKTSQGFESLLFSLRPHAYKCCLLSLFITSIQYAFALPNVLPNTHTLYIVGLWRPTYPCLYLAVAFLPSLAFGFYGYILRGTSGRGLHAFTKEGAFEAVKSGNIELILKLTEANSWVACGYNQRKIVRILLEYIRSSPDPALSINLKNLFGDTPLHVAVRNGCVKVEEILKRQRGIDLNIRNEKGKTAASLSDGYAVRVRRGFRNFNDFVVWVFLSNAEMLTLVFVYAVGMGAVNILHSLYLVLFLIFFSAPRLSKTMWLVVMGGGERRRSRGRGLGYSPRSSSASSSSSSWLTLDIGSILLFLVADLAVTLLSSSGYNEDVAAYLESSWEMSDKRAELSTFVWETRVQAVSRDRQMMAQEVYKKLQRVHKSVTGEFTFVDEEVWPTPRHESFEQSKRDAKAAYLEKHNALNLARERILKSARFTRLRRRRRSSLLRPSSALATTRRATITSAEAFRMAGGGGGMRSSSSQNHRYGAITSPQQPSSLQKARTFTSGSTDRKHIGGDGSRSQRREETMTMAPMNEPLPSRGHGEIYTILVLLTSDRYSLVTMTIPGSVLSMRAHTPISTDPAPMSSENFGVDKGKRYIWADSGCSGVFEVTFRHKHNYPLPWPFAEARNPKIYDRFYGSDQSMWGGSNYGSYNHNSDGHGDRHDRDTKEDDDELLLLSAQAEAPIVNRHVYLSDWTRLETVRDGIIAASVKWGDRGTADVTRMLRDIVGAAGELLITEHLVFSIARRAAAELVRIQNLKSESACSNSSGGGLGVGGGDAKVKKKKSRKRRLRPEDILEGEPREDFFLAQLDIAYRFKGEKREVTIKAGEEKKHGESIMTGAPGSFFPKQKGSFAISLRRLHAWTRLFLLRWIDVAMCTEPEPAAAATAAAMMTMMAATSREPTGEGADASPPSIEPSSAGGAAANSAKKKKKEKKKRQTKATNARSKEGGEEAAAPKTPLDHKAVISPESTVSKDGKGGGAKASTVNNPDPSLSGSIRAAWVRLAKMSSLQIMCTAVMSRTKWLCFVAILLNLVQNPTFLALCPTLAVLGYGIFQYPRPKKDFWRLLLAYYGISIFSKFGFQLGFFCISSIDMGYKLAPDPGCFDTSVSGFHVFGIYKTPSTHAFLWYVSGDLAVVFVLLLHRHMVIARGLWDRTEIEVYKEEPLEEDDVEEMSGGVDGNSNQRNKSAAVASAPATPTRPQRDTKKNAKKLSKHAVVAAPAAAASSPLDREKSGSSGSRNSKRKVTGSNNDNNSKFESVASPIVGWARGGIKGCLNRIETELFGEMGLGMEKKKGVIPGKDYFAGGFVLELLSAVMIVLTYSDLVGERKTLGQSLTSNRFSGDMVICFFIQLLFVILDRVVYLSQSIILKMALHYGSMWYWLSQILWVWPKSSSLLIQNNLLLKMFLLLKLIGFLFSALQIHYGYPHGGRVRQFHQVPGVYSGMLFKAYRAIPFAFEMQSLLDWACNTTSLDVWESFTLDDIYASMYIVQCDIIYRKSRRRGEPQPLYRKLTSGSFPFLALVLVLFGPLYLFSSANPAQQSNNVLTATLAVKINGPLGSYSLFSIPSVSSIRDVTETEFAAMKAQQVVQSDDKPTSVQRIEVNPFSDDLFGISPPALRQLISTLNDTERFPLMTMETVFAFTRPGPSTLKTIVGSHKLPLKDRHRAEIASLLKPHSGKRKLHLPRLIPVFLRLPATGDISVIGEANAISGADIRLEKVS